MFSFFFPLFFSDPNHVIVHVCKHFGHGGTGLSFRAENLHCTVSATEEYAKRDNHLYTQLDRWSNRQE